MCNVSQKNVLFRTRDLFGRKQPRYQFFQTHFQLNAHSGWRGSAPSLHRLSLLLPKFSSRNERLPVGRQKILVPSKREKSSFLSLKGLWLHITSIKGSQTKHSFFLSSLLVPKRKREKENSSSISKHTMLLKTIILGCDASDTKRFKNFSLRKKWNAEGEERVFCIHSFGTKVEHITMRKPTITQRDRKSTKLDHLPQNANDPRVIRIVSFLF